MMGDLETGEGTIGRETGSMMVSTLTGKEDLFQIEE